MRMIYVSAIVETPADVVIARQSKRDARLMQYRNKLVYIEKSDNEVR